MIERQRPVLRQDENRKLTKRKQKKAMKREKIKNKNRGNREEGLSKKNLPPPQVASIMAAYFRKKLDLDKILQNLKGGYAISASSQ
mmetsp:Transcript_27765/g.38787  ORF Transcript_27765/g.38787 Transcript_27765/m.38787 type:complete len:86 (-) Transcript_27765:209-466(-)